MQRNGNLREERFAFISIFAQVESKAVEVNAAI
jgi:hypothetical protein